MDLQYKNGPSWVERPFSHLIDGVYMKTNYEATHFSASAILKNTFVDIDDVFLVVDDRDKVVKMWRDLGLNTFQVAPGDF